MEKQWASNLVDGLALIKKAESEIPANMFEVEKEVLSIASDRIIAVAKELKKKAK